MRNVMKGIGWGLMALLSIFIAVFSAAPYAFQSLEMIQNSTTFAGRFTGALGALWLYAHAASAAVALLIGPFQFIKRLRDRNRTLHRWLGRVYLIGILVGGISGLILAQQTVTGMTGRFGFSLLALIWLYTGWQAYTNIRAGRTQVHKDWMTRNFALTFAAVMLRLYLGIGMASLYGSIGTVYPDEAALFIDLYATVAWLSWVPNLLIAEAIVHRRRRRREVSRRNTQRAMDGVPTGGAAVEGATSR